MATEMVKQSIKSLNTPFQEIFELRLDCIPIITINPQIQTLLEKQCSNLQMLYMNNCSLQNLENFPKLLNLVKLQLANNNLSGHHLKILQKCNQIRYLMINFNKISQFQELDFIKNLNLIEIQLAGNPIAQKQDYREVLFNSYETLEIIDHKDQKGKTVSQVKFYKKDQQQHSQQNSEEQDQQLDDQQFPQFSQSQQESQEQEKKLPRKKKK